jgi:hypothetical protein
VTFQVAATLSRVAEAQWLRTAEGLRRFSPLIGQLGEWKALCEGGWTGPVPGDLPDVDQMPGPPPSRAMQDAGPNVREFGRSSSTHSIGRLSLNVYGFLGLYHAPPRPLPVPDSSTAVALNPPPAIYDDGSVRSIASLGSFPEPPNYFPIPPLTTSFSSNSASNSPTLQHGPSVVQGDGPVQSRMSSDVSGSGSGPHTVLPRVTESPMEESATAAFTNGSPSSGPSQDQSMAPLTTPVRDGMNEVPAAADRPGPVSDEPDEAKVGLSRPTFTSEPPRSSLQASVSPSPILVPGPQQQQQADTSPVINSRSSSSTGASSSFRRGDYLDNREFGLDSSAETAQLRAKTLDSAQRRIEGSDASKGSGGVVAAIRDKYARAVSTVKLFRCLNHR